MRQIFYGKKYCWLDSNLQPSNIDFLGMRVSVHQRVTKLASEVTLATGSSCQSLNTGLINLPIRVTSSAAEISSISCLIRRSDYLCHQSFENRIITRVLYFTELLAVASKFSYYNVAITCNTNKLLTDEATCMYWDGVPMNPSMKLIEQK